MRERERETESEKRIFFRPSGLGGFLALGPGNGLDGAERSVEPGLLSSLHLVESQAQVMLQVLEGGREGT